MAIDPDELDKMNSGTLLRSKFDDAQAQQQQSSHSLQKEDLSDMVAEFTAGKSSSSSAAKKKKPSSSDAAKNFKF